jgi:glucose dehydrogenase
LGGADSPHYSALKRINRSNVNKLHVEWVFPTGDKLAYAFNPLIAHGIVYVLARNGSIVSLDAETGRFLWSHPITPPGMHYNSFVTWNYRGISYWQNESGSDRRLLFVSNNYLQEINARTGKLITSFGENGLVDLRLGLGRNLDQVKRIESGTLGRVCEKPHH